MSLSTTSLTGPPAIRPRACEYIHPFPPSQAISPPPPDEDEKQSDKAEEEVQTPREELWRLSPSAVLSVEEPSGGNGNVYQVRTTVGDEVFIGRGVTEAEATEKCCRKAVKFIRLYFDPLEKRFLAPHERRKPQAPGAAAATATQPSSTSLAAWRKRHTHEKRGAEDEVQLVSFRTVVSKNDEDGQLLPKPFPSSRPPHGRAGNDTKRMQRGFSKFATDANTEHLGVRRGLLGGKICLRRSQESQNVFPDYCEQCVSYVEPNNNYYYEDSGYGSRDRNRRGARDKLKKEKANHRSNNNNKRDRSNDEVLRDFDIQEEAKASEEEERKRQRPPIPTLVISSEDCEDEYCEFVEEKLKPNVPIKNAVMMLNELFPPPKAPQYKVRYFL